MSDSRPPPAAQRRFVGGARRAASDRVVLRGPWGEQEGWALNVSRGGVRLVIEGTLQVGDLLEVQRSEGDAPPRPGRVAWVKAAPDGQILGIQYLDTVGSIPPADDPP